LAAVAASAVQLIMTSGSGEFFDHKGLGYYFESYFGLLVWRRGGVMFRIERHGTVVPRYPSEAMRPMPSWFKLA